MKTHKKHFNETTGTLLAINYIVGFGFIATITGIVNLGKYGILVLLLASVIALGTVFVFSRLTNEYRNEYGGSLNYASKIGNKPLTFLMAWNIYVQVPLFAATGPLFLEQIARLFTSDNTTIWIVRGLSILFFVGLILFSTLGLKVSKWAIFLTAAVKWIILAIGFGILIKFAIEFKFFASNFNNPKVEKSISTYAIVQNVLFFMFAFGGIETVPTSAKDIKFKNFKKILLIVFVVIFTIYMIGYVLFLGTDFSKVKPGFVGIYATAFSTVGLVIFGIYLFTYNVSSSLSSASFYARFIYTMAKEGFLPRVLTKTNKKGEYSYAMWFNTVVTLIGMIFFALLPALFPNLNFFRQVVELGTFAFLTQYLLTFITALILSSKGKIQKIPIFEYIAYIIVAAMIGFILVVYLIPPIVGQKWEVQNTISIVSYGVFAIIGFTLYWVSQHPCGKVLKRWFDKTPIVEEHHEHEHVETPAMETVGAKMAEASETSNMQPSMESNKTTFKYDKENQ